MSNIDDNTHTAHWIVCTCAVASDHKTKSQKFVCLKHSGSATVVGVFILTTS